MRPRVSVYRYVICVQREEKECSTPDEEWAALQQVIYNTVKTHLGKLDKKHQDYRLLLAEKEAKPTRECCKLVALDPPPLHIIRPADCYKNASVHSREINGEQ